MDSRTKRRRNWIVFWLAVPTIPILAYLAFALYLALTMDFSELPR